MKAGWPTPLAAKETEKFLFLAENSLFQRIT
jgi:hypothetical protein